MTGEHAPSSVKRVKWLNVPAGLCHALVNGCTIGVGTGQLTAGAESGLVRETRWPRYSRHFWHGFRYISYSKADWCRIGMFLRWEKALAFLCRIRCGCHY